MARLLAILCGLPRSGKTTVAKQLEQRGYIAVCPDDIRYALHGEQFIASAEPFVWATAETMARALLWRGRSVVIDATNTTARRREQWVRLAREYGITPDLYVMDTPLDVCLARNNGYIQTAVIERMHRQWERPTCEEGRLLSPLLNGDVAVLSCTCPNCALEASMRKHVEA